MRPIRIALAFAVSLCGCFDFSAERFGHEGEPCFVEDTCAGNLRCSDDHICVNPCALADCSGRGTCTPERGIARCACDEGYVEVNEACVGPGQAGQTCFEDFTCDGELFCDAARSCVVCTANAATVCVASHIQSVDSCGRPESIAQHCAYWGCDSVNRVCLTPSWPLAPAVLDLGGDAFNLDLAQAADGTLVLAVDHETPGPGRDIFVWQYDVENGYREISPGSASGGGVSNTAAGSIRPAIAQDQRGTTYLTWVERSGTNGNGQPVSIPAFRELVDGTWRSIPCDGAEPASNGRVYTTAFGDDVYFGWAEVLGKSSLWKWNGTVCTLVSDPSKGWNPTTYVRSIAAGPDHSLFVTGLEVHGSATQLYVARFASDAWSTHTFNDPRFADVFVAFVAVSPDGDAIVAASDNGYGAGDVFAFEFADGRWGDIGGNISASVLPTLGLDVATDGFGYPAVIWMEDGSPSIFLKRWNGSSWTGYGPLGDSHDVLASPAVPPIAAPSLAPSIYGLCGAWLDGMTASIRCERLL